MRLAGIAVRSFVVLSLLVAVLVASNVKAIGVDVLFDQKTVLELDSRLSGLCQAESQQIRIAYGGAEDGLSAAQQVAWMARNKFKKQAMQLLASAAQL